MADEKVVVFRASPELVGRIDGYRAGLPGVPTRAAAIRQAIEAHLDGEALRLAKAPRVPRAQQGKRLQTRSR